MTETIVTGEEITTAILEDLKITEYDSVRVFDQDREVMNHDLTIKIQQNLAEEALKDFDPEESENLAYENKQMAEALLELGFSDEDVSNICNGSLKVNKKQTFLVYSTNEFQSLDSYTLEGVTSSLINAHEVVKKLFASYKYNIKAVIKVTEIDSNSFEDFEVYDYNYGLEWKNKISDTEMGFLAHLTD